MPPILSLATRFLSDRLKGLGAWSLAAFWWLLEWAGDKLLGDAAFSWLRDMVSPLAHYPWIALLWTYGAPVGLIGLGAFFFWRAGSLLPHSPLVPADPKAATPPPSATLVSKPPKANAPNTSPIEADSMSKSLPGWENIYQVTQSGAISLRFLPDTKKPLGEALCLILLAHKLMYGRDKVSVAVIEDGLRQSLRNKPTTPLETALELQAMAIELMQNIGVDAVDSGKVERIDLAKGGSYTFTWWGEAETLATAKDMIRRA